MNSKPNFTGAWQVDFGRSELEIEAPASSLFEIEHDEPSLALKRTHKAEGYEDTFSLVISTDGRQVVTHRGDVEIRSTCVWQENSLCFRSKIIARGSTAENIVIYSLTEDGNAIVADERFTGPPRSYHNKWVLLRQPKERS